MKELNRHRLVFKLLLPPIGLFMKFKFNYKYDSIKDVEGPYLMIANHNMELDPLSLGCAAGNQLYFVASEHLLRKGILSKLLMYFIKPIPHKKGKQGVRTVKTMLKYLQEGVSIAIFPEGNRSFNGMTMEMMPAIGRVAKRSGAKLVTYKIEGGYLTQPRWSTTLRRGELRGCLVNVYTPEQMAEMSEEEINECIIRDLSEDAYATQERLPVAYKGKNLALGMESTLFRCPACGQMGTLHSDSTSLFCDCGFKADYDAFGYLTDSTGKKLTVTEIEVSQRKAFEEYLASYESDEAIFEDEVTVRDIDKDHEIAGTESVKLKVYNDRLEFGSRTYGIEEIEGMAIYSRNSLVLHIKRHPGHFEFKGEVAFNALKYLYWFEITEKMEK